MDSEPLFFTTSWGHPVIQMVPWSPPWLEVRVIAPCSRAFSGQDQLQRAGLAGRRKQQLFEVRQSSEDLSVEMERLTILQSRELSQTWVRARERIWILSLEGWTFIIDPLGTNCPVWKVRVLLIWLLCSVSGQCAYLIEMYMPLLRSNTYTCVLV